MLIKIFLKKNYCILLMGIKISIAIIENSMELLQTIKIKLPCNQLLAYISKGNAVSTLKRLLYYHVCYSTLHKT